MRNISFPTRNRTRVPGSGGKEPGSLDSRGSPSGIVKHKYTLKLWSKHSVAGLAWAKSAYALGPLLAKYLPNDTRVPRILCSNRSDPPFFQALHRPPSESILLGADHDIIVHGPRPRRWPWKGQGYVWILEVCVRCSHVHVWGPSKCGMETGVVRIGGRSVYLYFLIDSPP